MGKSDFSDSNLHHISAPAPTSTSAKRGRKVMCRSSVMRRKTWMMGMCIRIIYIIIHTSNIAVFSL